MRTYLRLQVETFGVLILLAFSGTALGQIPATSLHELAVLVGAQVEVVDDRGLVRTGRLIEASETGVRLSVNGKEVRLAAPRIEEISRRSGDSLRNGVLIGAGIGAAFIVTVSVADALSSDVPTSSDYWEGAVLESLLFAGIGAGIGAGIDAVIQREKTVLFRATASKVALVPTVTRHQKGIALSVRF